MATAADWKEKGNQAMKDGSFEDAVAAYTEAIKLNPTDPVFWSNRCAAELSLDRVGEALADAEKSIELKPEWGKAWVRKGTALFRLKKMKEAEEAFQTALKYDPTSEVAKDSLGQLERIRKSGESLLGILSGDIWGVLRANPSTAAFCHDPTFIDTMNAVQSDPSQLMQLIGTDRRISTALQVLMTARFPKEAGETASGSGGKACSDGSCKDGSCKPADGDACCKDKDGSKQGSCCKDEAKQGSCSASGQNACPRDASEPAKASTEAPKASPASDASDAAKPAPPPTSAENVRAAVAAKNSGNDAYKARNFDLALQHYSQAWELDPTNISVLTNMASAYLEMGDFAKALERCELAVDQGRALRSDYTLIAKAYDRMGNVYQKQKDLANAIKAWNKSLSEDRNAEVLKKRNQAEKDLADEQRTAYLDPAKAEVARLEGNEHFTKQRYPEAVASYTEAIKRNPEDPKVYVNRATTLFKLQDFGRAVADCDAALQRDPKYVKAFVRKGLSYYCLNNFKAAVEAFEAALTLDPENAEAEEGLQKTMQRLNKMGEGNDSQAAAEAAMKDPEIIQILSDPAMRAILEDMQRDPKAIREHIKNPKVRDSIQKLMTAGIIKMR